jgi:tetratricopeptide (TPR) repeat protein
MTNTISTILLFFACTCSTHGSSADSLYRVGERAYNSGKYKEAIASFSQVLELDKDHINAYLQRGFCQTLNKNYEAAVSDFSEVIKRNEKHLWAYTSRGSAYNKLGKYNLAMSDFNTVLELDPRNGEAFNNRGWSRKFLGDKKGACKDWKDSAKSGNGEAKIIMKNNHCK